ncbi:MAG: hypothetical protein MUD08_12910 [Cytophagales bacterium]|jgi:hypothetical protein|nr:hypothetical protein [Cytophagales bacterium]
MQTRQASKQLAQGWQKEQSNLCRQQTQQIRLGTNNDLANSRFYLKTLSGLVVCGELVITNAQLKELNRAKLLMLRQRITEVSAKVEAFKDLLRDLHKPFKAI